MWKDLTQSMTRVYRPPDCAAARAKKEPGQGAGLGSLFAVTHKAPAQGGKAGGSPCGSPINNVTAIPKFVGSPDTLSGYRAIARHITSSWRARTSRPCPGLHGCC